MRCRELLLGCRSEGKTAFVPYITAGDPNPAATVAYARALAAGGAGIIELGVPFSDPVADGVTNQRAAQRALAAGTRLDRVFDIVRSLRRDGVTTPIVLFSYLNPIHRMGYETFAMRAADSGVDGVLVVDLPPEEAGDHCRAMAAAGLETVFIAAPTTSADRLSLINERSTGFVYAATRLGVTGVRQDADAEAMQRARGLRETLRSPFVAGFGISTPQQASLFAGIADGVVVGSALVNALETAGNEKEGAAAVRTLTESFQAALRRPATVG